MSAKSFVDILRTIVEPANAESGVAADTIATDKITVSVTKRIIATVALHDITTELSQEVRLIKSSQEKDFFMSQC
jgi:hypothetical protein